MHNTGKTRPTGIWTSQGVVAGLLVCAVLSVAMSCKPKEDASGSDKFHRARNFYIKGDYDKAIKGMKHFLSRKPNSKLCSRAWFIIGKAQLGKGNLDHAFSAFMLVMELYPKTLEADKARYKLAFIYELKGEHNKAIERYGEISKKQSVMRAEAAARLNVLRKMQP